MAMQYYKCVVGYDGSRYKGWQRLKATDQTIQGKIEAVLTKLFKVPIEIQGSGRTDAGAHADQQVFSFFVQDAIETEVLRKQMNRYLPEDIVIKEVVMMNRPFHARYEAKEKTYLYRVWKAAYPPLFERALVSSSDLPLDIESMRAAAEHFLGEKDFRGFCTDKTKKSTYRKIKRIDVVETENEVQFYFTGDGFLYNMVRIMVGTLLEIGEKKRPVSSIEDVFLSKNREDAGPTAPAQGLILVDVKYQ